MDNNQLNALCNEMLTAYLDQSDNNGFADICLKHKLEVGSGIFHKAIDRVVSWVENGSEMTGLSKDLTSFFRSSLAETVEVFKEKIEREENPELEVKLIKARQSKLSHLFTVSQICKSATAFATVGGDLTADGLLIRQMLEKMKEGGE